MGMPLIAMNVSVVMHERENYITPDRGINAL